MLQVCNTVFSEKKLQLQLQYTKKQKQKETSDESQIIRRSTPTNNHFLN